MNDFPKKKEENIDIDPGHIPACTHTTIKISRGLRHMWKWSPPLQGAGPETLKMTVMCANHWTTTIGLFWTNETMN